MVTFEIWTPNGESLLSEGPRRRQQPQSSEGPWESLAGSVMQGRVRASPKAITPLFLAEASGAMALSRIASGAMSMG